MYEIFLMLGWEFFLILVSIWEGCLLMLRYIIISYLHYCKFKILNFLISMA